MRKKVLKRCTFFLICFIIFMNGLSVQAKYGCLDTDNSVNADGGIFAEYVNSAAPGLREIIAVTEYDSVYVSEFTYSTLDNINYGFLAYPKEPGMYPGRFLCHGGGGSALGLKNDAICIAENGYIVCGCDIPGTASTSGAIYSEGEWKNRSYGSGMIFEASDPTEYDLYDGIVAALEAFHIMQSNMAILSSDGKHMDDIKINAEKIGISGVSWGGWSANMLAAILGEQIDAAFVYYGAGFQDYDLSQWSLSGKFAALSEQAKKLWILNMDAGRRTEFITAPYFLATATNDFYYHPPQAMMTIEKIKGERGLSFSPNVSHMITVPGGNNKQGFTPMEETYFDYYLKNIGSPFQQVNYKSQGFDKDGNYVVEYNVFTAEKYPIKTVSFYYSINNVHWTDRKWEKIDLNCISKTDTGFSVVIPEEILSADIDCYITCSDERPVSVSSIITTVSADEVKYGFDVTMNEESGMFQISGKNDIASNIVLFVYDSDNKLVYFDVKNKMTGKYEFAYHARNAGQYRFVVGLRNNKTKYSSSKIFTWEG